MSSIIKLSTEVVGKPVKTMEGNQLGTIENLMIDLNDGRLVYIVLVTDGFLGETHRYFAIPRSDLKIESGNPNEFVIEVETEELKHAKGFNPEKWSLTPCQDGVEAVYELYGYESVKNKTEKEARDINFN